MQKQARQLKIDANSAMFRDAVRCYWMPRLLEKMSSSQSMPSLIDSTAGMIGQTPPGPPQQLISGPAMRHPSGNHSPSSTSSGSMALPQLPRLSELSPAPPNTSYSGVSFNPFVGGHSIDHGDGPDAMDLAPLSASQLGSTLSDYTMPDNNCIDDIDDGFWNMDESWYVRKLHEWGGI